MPSDRSMRFVAVDLVCSGHPEGDEPILARFYIESHFEAFRDEQVSEGQNRAVVERTFLRDAQGDEYLHYKFLCPKCGRSPVSRESRINRGLEALYEPGAYAKVRRIRI